MASSLLWESSDRTVAVVDVPRSISDAQSTANRPFCDILLSSEPLLCPFPSNEPKSAAAKARLMNNTVEESFHAEYSSILQQALEQVRQHYQGSWCLPRPFITAPNRPANKRKLEGSEDNKSLQPSSYRVPPELPRDVPFHANNSASEEIFHVKATTGEGVDERYRVPPFSTFSLSDCSSSRSFAGGVRNQAQDDSTRRHFDLIILDPPWPNRSVKRSHRTPGRSYATSTTLDDVNQLVLGMDLDMLMADNCLVGCWITNKAAVRELVLGPGGVFESWGVELVEEWIWLKTTAEGEPVSLLDSLWRKPYEVLLLGRKRRSSEDGTVKRKTIISVPDLHSRKPCLKCLLEPMLPDPQNYRALEVFARHLVSGWWSWGNECIKFNWSGHWNSPSEIHAV